MRHLIYNQETQQHEYVYRPDDWKPEETQQVVIDLNPKAEGLEEVIAEEVEKGNILVFDVEERKNDDTDNSVEVADEDFDLK